MKISWFYIFALLAWKYWYWLVFCENGVYGNSLWIMGRSIWERIMKIEYIFCVLKTVKLDWKRENWDMRGKMVILHRLYGKHWELIFCIDRSWKWALEYNWANYTEMGFFSVSGRRPYLWVCVCGCAFPLVFLFGIVVGRDRRVARLVV